jgi:hypothetical protein
MKYIREIDYSHYNLSANNTRLMNVLVPNYFYHLEVGDFVGYYFDSNSLIDDIIVEVFPNMERIVLLSEQRLYLFSTETGNITMALRLWAPEIQLIPISDFIIIITEREVYKIDIRNSIVHSLLSLSDTFIKYALEGNTLTVYTYDDKSINMII